MNTADDEVRVMIPCGKWDELSQETREKLQTYAISGSVIPGLGMVFTIGRSRLDEICQDVAVSLSAAPCEDQLGKDLVLEAVLLFHSGGPFTEDAKCRWNEIAARLLGPPKYDDYHYLRYCSQPRTWECTTKVLCNMVRVAQGVEPKKGQHEKRAVQAR